AECRRPRTGQPGRLPIESHPSPHVRLLRHPAGQTALGPRTKPGNRPKPERKPARMLSHLHIQNFAIIQELNLELEGGMTVLSGETGAGKSILVDALGLLLGDRADTEIIRPGAERAEINAECQRDHVEPARQWLEERDLLDDSEPNRCVLRRVLLQQGRTRAYINGRPCNARDLKTLGEMLIDIHGQHAHQSLMRSDVQREILDSYSGCEALLV